MNTNMAEVKNRSGTSFTNASECKYEFVHTELVQLFYDIKWICSGAFEFEKNNNKQSLKIDAGTPKKTWYVKCNKTFTALHFVQYDVLWSTE